MTESRSASRQSAHSPALDAECDQQIIDACMAGDAVLAGGVAGVIAGVAESGVDAQTLASRADELRISAAFIRKCRLSGAHPGMRVCLNCDARFLSAGSHNRLCRSCGRA